tara:strand:- start:218 stop:1474 length:1257 start_codon:yes stop_codon:yes gene_type:complete
MAFLISAFLILSSHAGWNTEAIYTAKTFQVGVDNLGFEDSYETSFWGSLKARWFLAKSAKKKKIWVKEAFRNRIPVMYHVQQEKRWRHPKYDSRDRDVMESEAYYVDLKRPLIIYLPGIFNNAASSHSRRAYDRFEKLGYHFLALPNPWSKDYINANPYGAKPGDVLHEAVSLRKVMDKAIDLIGKENITSIELVGASYGAFVAGVIQAFEDPNDPLFSTTTIISPPMDFRYSIPYIDEQMLSVSGKVEENDIWDNIKLVFDYLLAGFRTDIDEENLEKAKPYTIQIGFKQALLKSIKEYAKVHDLDWIPHFDDEKEQAEWEDNFVFNYYFENHAPEILKVLQSEFASLHYWIDAAQASNFSPRIITADDDFLNPEFFPTKSMFENYPPATYLSLPEGGHLGFLAFPWYESFYSKVWN